jgi:hypothetical protein
MMGKRERERGSSIINRDMFLFYYFFRRLAYSPYTQPKNKSFKSLVLGQQIIPQ